MNRSFYPDDLCKGFFPLIFAVNAIHRKDDDDDTIVDSSGTSSKCRSLFDLFLDAIAASLMDAGTTAPDPAGSSGSIGGAPSSTALDAPTTTTASDTKTGGRRMSSLFNKSAGTVTDEEDSSDNDDDGLADHFGGNLSTLPIARRRTAASGFGFGRRAAAATAATGWR